MSLTTNPQVSIGAWIPTSGGGGSGTVTSVSVVSAHGFAGSVATASTTPAITLSTTITGVLKGDGTSISAATAGTDYQAPITLTTTGSSGAATFISNTLNIPQYTGGGGTIYIPITVSMPGPRVVANDVTNWFIVPVGLTFTAAYVVAKTGPTGANLILDIQKSTNGGSSFTSIYATHAAYKPTITAGSNTGSSTSFDTTTASTQDILRFDIDQVGSTIAGSDITLTLVAHE